MAKHSKLSPSSSKMWIACPPSAQLNAKMPDKGSEYAAQGTDAHTLCETKLRKALGVEAEDPREGLAYLDAEMEECSDAYVQFVMEKVEAAENPIVMVEQRLDFSRFVPEGFGTGDCVIVSEGNLHIIDFKYGTGIAVSAGSDEDGVNPQLACYSLGALSAFDGIYDIDTVSMSIFQPRREVAETYTVTKDSLLKWAEEVLCPAARLAAEGSGEYKAGDHCQFCKAKQICRKRAEYNLELARYDFEKPDTLGDEEIEAVLARADEFISWANDVKEYAFNAAVAGKVWAGWKLVEGRSNRKYVSEDAVADAVNKAGFDPYEHKVLGITAMTRLLGRTKFDELLGSLIEKPAGKPTLVPMSDRRPALKNSAQEDFMEGKAHD
ncbi:MAG: DUF2800 domain-containing protein [Lachnospiraceae bacterium]|nr:DUF2800 domain-containing protein [Lachnospiraceae bacterium]